MGMGQWVRRDYNDGALLGVNNDALAHLVLIILPRERNFLRKGSLIINR